MPTNFIIYPDEGKEYKKGDIFIVEHRLSAKDMHHGECDVYELKQVDLGELSENFLDAIQHEFANVFVIYDILEQITKGALECG